MVPRFGRIRMQAIGFTGMAVGMLVLVAAVGLTNSSLHIPLVFVGFILFNLLMKDRKSTRLNSSHLVISYAVFCLKKKNNNYAYPEHYYSEPSCRDPCVRRHHSFLTTTPTGT